MGHVATFAVSDNNYFTTTLVLWLRHMPKYLVIIYDKYNILLLLLVCVS